MIQIIGPALSQWDVGRSVKITNIEADCVHLANKGDSKAVIMEIADAQAKIPDYLLQTGKQLCVYAVKDGITVESKTFYVQKRERPENYVYDDDQRNYIYELITSAEMAVEDANQAADSATVAALGANTSAGRANSAAAGASEAAKNANDAADKANASVGNLGDLETKDKSSLVAAINEVARKGGTGTGGEVFVPKAQVTQTANGATITITDQHGTSEATVNHGKDGEPGVYILAEGETIADAPADADVVIDPAGTPDVDLSDYAKTEDIPTDAHIDNLINTALGVIENGSY